MTDTLTASEVHERLSGHPHWSVVDGKLHRELRFADFTAAFAFMASVALVAERMGHHPEWSNVYDRVQIDLTTHDAGGITDKDFALVAHIDAVAPAA